MRTFYVQVKIQRQRRIKVFCGRRNYSLVSMAKWKGVRPECDSWRIAPSGPWSSHPRDLQSVPSWLACQVSGMIGSVL